MNLTQFGKLVKQKYLQYAQVPAEVVAQKVTEKFPEYKKAVTSNISLMKEFPKRYNQAFPRPPTNDWADRYGQDVVMGYNTSKFPLVQNVDYRGVQNWLNERNLPGQVMAGAAADMQESSHVYQIQKKMEMGAPLTEQEKRLMSEQSVQFVANVSNPLNKTVYRGTGGTQANKAAIYGKGEYFAASEEVAKKYGSVISQEINAEKYFDSSKPLSANIIDEYVGEYAKVRGVSPDVVRKEINFQKENGSNLSYLDVVQNVKPGARVSTGDELAQFEFDNADIMNSVLRKNGYDGITAKELRMDKQTDNIIYNRFPQPTKGVEAVNIKAFHGSEGKYDAIPDKPIAKADNKGNQSALGMWYSPKKEIAEFYGKNVVESQLNLTNPKVYEAKDFNLMKGKTDFLELRKQLESQGYDGVFVKPGKGSNAEYAVFNSKSISPTKGVEAPKTVRVWNKSKFSNDGAYADIPVIRKENNITLYQGGKPGDNRQFWTPDKKYAEQFGNVKEKTGTFYEVDNGNRLTKVYVEAQPTQGVETNPFKTPEDFIKSIGSKPYISGQPLGWYYKKNGVPTRVSSEVSDMLDKFDYKPFKRSNIAGRSNNLYHTTPITNLDSIAKDGLVTRKPARFEGVSSPTKISFSANEKGAAYYGGSNDVMLRTKRGYDPGDLDIDLLAGGEGTYRTGKNIPPDMLEVKIKGKWIPLAQYKQSK